jgi:hypothetical protein
MKAGTVQPAFAEALRGIGERFNLPVHVLALSHKEAVEAPVFREQHLPISEGS